MKDHKRLVKTRAIKLCMAMAEIGSKDACVSQGCKSQPVTYTVYRTVMTHTPFPKSTSPANLLTFGKIMAKSGVPIAKAKVRSQNKATAAPPQPSAPAAQVADKSKRKR